MSTAKINNLQIGQSGTASQNFVISVPAVPDGTMTISRGNVGGTLTQICKINADGGVNHGGPAFSAYPSTGQTVGTTAVKINLQAEEFDTANVFDAVTNSRFQPNVAGYYSLTGSVQAGSGSASIQLFMYKNGANHKSGALVPAAAFLTVQMNLLIYLNGISDYVELWATQSVSQGITTGAANGTYFQGHLVRAA